LLILEIDFHEALDSLRRHTQNDASDPQQAPSACVGRRLAGDCVVEGRAQGGLPDDVVDTIDERIEVTITNNLAGLADRLHEMVGEQTVARLYPLPIAKSSGTESIVPSRSTEVSQKGELQSQQLLAEVQPLTKLWRH
jgi:hypothetical protein